MQLDRRNDLHSRGCLICCQITRSFRNYDLRDLCINSDKIHDCRSFIQCCGISRDRNVLRSFLHGSALNDRSRYRRFLSGILTGQQDCRDHRDNKYNSRYSAGDCFPIRHSKTLSKLH